VGRTIAGAGLVFLSLLMLLGFVQADAEPGAPATLIALLVGVVIPAAGGAYLLSAPFRARGRLARRRAELRERAVEGEILRLARELGGRVTVVEAVAELGLAPEEATRALDWLATRGTAEVEITDSGLLVYSFYDILHLGEKSSARGVLE
jgi:hypothetical protein